MQTLSINPPRWRYKAVDGESLAAALSAADRTAELSPAGSASDAVMGPDGLLGCGFRFSTWALYQVCRLAGPGLYRCLQSLTAGGDEAGRLAAVDVYNRVIRHRHRERLAGQMWLINRVAGVVEAVVSPTYRFLSNLDLHAAAGSAAAVAGYRLAEAELTGRWLLVRYYHPKPLFSVFGDAFHAGLHYSNHEGGQASLAGYSTVVRARGLLTLAVEDRTPKVPRRLRHAGDGFRRRLSELLSGTLAAPPDGAAVEGFVRVRKEEKLGLGLSREGLENARRGEIVRALSRSLPGTLASRILANTILQPHHATEPRPLLAITRSDLQALTSWDLVVSACREARLLPIALRERADRTAFALLSGHLRTR